MKPRYLTGFEAMKKLALLVVLLAGCSAQVDAGVSVDVSSAGAPSVGGSSAVGGASPGAAGAHVVFAGASAAGAPSEAGEAGSASEAGAPEASGGASSAGASAGGAPDQGGAPNVAGSSAGGAPAGGSSAGASVGGSSAGAPSGVAGAAEGGAPGVACPYHVSSENISPYSGHTIGATFLATTWVDSVDLTPLAGFTIVPIADGVQISKAFAGGSLWAVPSNNRMKAITLEITPYTATPLMPAGGLAMYCKP